MCICITYAYTHNIYIYLHTAVCRSSLAELLWCIDWNPKSSGDESQPQSPQVIAGGKCSFVASYVKAKLDLPGIMGVSKNSGRLLGVLLTIRIRVYWGLLCGPLYFEGKHVEDLLYSVHMTMHGWAPDRTW